MGFIDAVRTCFFKYAQFSGRAGRAEFWWFFLFVAAVTALLSLADGQIFGIDPATGEPRRVLSGIFQLATFLPLLAVAWRRMHDSGLPGWYILLPMLFSIVVAGTILGGVAAFSLLEMIGSDGNFLIMTSALLGASWAMFVGLAQLVLLVLMIYWLTRGSTPRANRYGS